MIKLFLLFFVCVQLVHCWSYGTAFYSTNDVTNNLGCLRQNFNAAIFRVFTNGQPDSIGAKNYQTAAMSFYPEAYIESLVELDPSKSGIDEFNAFFGPFSNYAKHRSVWVDLSDPNKWENNTCENIQKLNEFFNAARGKCFTIGIYTNSKAHETIIGTGHYYECDVRVWYQGTNQNPDARDYIPINNIYWPVMKQSCGGNAVCDTNVNWNYYFYQNAELHKNCPQRKNILLKNNCQIV